jgi:hypothetical protein
MAGAAKGPCPSQQGHHGSDPAMSDTTLRVPLGSRTPWQHGYGPHGCGRDDAARIARSSFVRGPGVVVHRSEPKASSESVVHRTVTAVS